MSVEEHASEPAMVAHRSNETPQSGDLAVALALSLRESLPPVLAGLCGLYFFFGVSHLLLLPRAVAGLMAAVAFGTAVAFLLTRAVLRRWSVPTEWSHAIGAGVTALALFNSLLHLYLLGDPQQSTNVALVIIGAGSFFLSRRWLALLLTTALAGWGIIVYQVWDHAPTSAWLHFAFLLIGATVLAMLIHLVRLHAFRRIEQLRLQDRQQQTDLEVTIQALRQSEARLQQTHDELDLQIQERTRQLAQVNEELRTEIAERRQAEENVRFLAEIGTLLTSSLDYDVTLTQVARLAVPHLADYCIVDMIQEDHGLHQVAVAHVNPAKEILIRELRRRSPFNPDLPYGVAKVLRDGRPELVPAMSDSLWSATAKGDPEYLQIVRALDPLSYIIVPLVARGRTLGAISFVAAESRRHFGPDDLQLAEEVASRAAHAVDNARLYREAQEAMQHAEEARARLDTLFATAPIGLTFLDRELRYVRINAALAAINGLPPEAHLGRTPPEVLPGVGEEVEARYRRVLETGEPLLDQEISGETPAAPGQQRHWLASYYPLRGADGQLLGVGAVVTDMTERMATEAALRESEARLSSIIGLAMDAIISIDADQHIVVFNAAAEQMFRCTAAAALGHTIDRFIPVALREAHGRHIQLFGQTHATSRSMQSLQSLTALRADGEEFPIEATISQAELAGQKLYTVIIRDITERKAAEEALRQHALYDPLTGLANRTLFMDRLGHAVLELQRRPLQQFAVLFLDLDRFKTVNDSLGHTVGDQLLKGIARRLETCLRPGDTVARLGGDEFTILLPELHDIGDATHIVERIHQAMSVPFQLDGHQVVTNASIGIVLSTPEYTQPEELLRDADTALNRAKAQRKGRYEVFDRAMHTQAMRLLELEADLRRAIELQEFVLHYQPIVALDSGEVTGVEALVRWQHPARGLVSPAEFIPLAEETGLIVPLGDWVLRAACAQAKAWQAGGLPGLCMAVNVSAQQFKHKDVRATIAQILQETGFTSACLELELTESSVMENAEAIIASLGELKEMGIHLSVDDFGTGYSSLSYLKRLPITAVKVDRSFVRDITSDPNDAAITTAIIAMAYSLNLRVIAEGVETAEQLAFLRKQKCDAAQGYLFSRPLPPEALARLVQTRQNWTGEATDQS